MCSPPRGSMVTRSRCWHRGGQIPAGFGPMSATIGHLVGEIRRRRCFTPRAIGAANIRRGIFRTSPAPFKPTPIASSTLSSIPDARRRWPRLPSAGRTAGGRSSNWPIPPRTRGADAQRRQSRRLRWKRSVGSTSCSRSSVRSMDECWGTAAGSPGEKCAAADRF